ncbi:hypothetical protein DFH08DRAFT_935845 [Mycena albidolilacea]|uniref:Uncharacterized protein n=1 Tax=Mycena albidolilacea TaxID=1033008 RepID=A0AAD7EV43_9AGAR|nr:hypothetical protein DFH08DRAFT_935845 [Mycena albidolilacea]
MSDEYSPNQFIDFPGQLGSCINACMIPHIQGLIILVKAWITRASEFIREDSYCSASCINACMIPHIQGLIIFVKAWITRASEFIRDDPYCSASCINACMIPHIQGLIIFVKAWSTRASVLDPIFPRISFIPPAEQVQDLTKVHRRVCSTASASCGAVNYISHPSDEGIPPNKVVIDILSLQSSRDGFGVAMYIRRFNQDHFHRFLDVRNPVKELAHKQHAAFKAVALYFFCPKASLGVLNSSL